MRTEAMMPGLMGSVAGELERSQTPLPPYPLYESVCDRGLSVVRPLGPAAKTDDEWGWNFGRACPPSYAAFGRMRALLAITQALALRPKRVLEVAAGDASLCASLAQAGCEVFANDLREENLRRAVRNYLNCDAIQIVPGDLFGMDPASIGTFDLVIACEVLEHVAHTGKFLSQLKRFLAPGGRLLLTTPNGRYFLNTLPTHSQVEDFEALTSRQFQPDADGHLFLITPREMCQLAEQAGLRVERLDLWGTPLMTGHIRLRTLAARPLLKAFFAFEAFCQRLPFRARQKICTAMSVVLSA